MNKLNFTPFPVLKTKRLVLRKLEIKDVDSIFSMRSDKVSRRYLDAGHHNSIKDSISFLEMINQGIKENKWILWGITLPKNDELIGTICIWNISKDQQQGELGYELRNEFTKQGYMNESIYAVLEYSFTNLKLERLEAFTHKNNIASSKLLERCRFKLNKNAVDESNLNNIIYSLAQIDWETNN